MERVCTCKGISEIFGVSAETVRQACRRGEGMHPLPHTRAGAKRPIYYIRPSVFEAWLAEEERLQVRK